MFTPHLFLPHLSFLCRSKLAIIPQDPFLFSGTIRENLDPLGRHADSDLYQVLEQCHLQEVIVQMGEFSAVRRQGGSGSGKGRP